MYQQPTLTHVHVRSIRDALQIFYAVARHILPIISRRLDPDERKAIAPGNVYVWEERSANSDAAGLTMERWTDGLTWGASRVRDEFLFYEPRENDKHLCATLNTILQRPRKTTPRLVKQTYSVFVSLPEDRQLGIQRKWHITAYWSQETVDSLKSVSEIPGVGDVPVPSGWFKSARAAKTRKQDPQGEPIQTTFAVHKAGATLQPAPRPFGISPAGCPPYENLHVFPSAFDTISPMMQHKEEPEGEFYPGSGNSHHVISYQRGHNYRSVSPSPSQSSFSSSEHSSPSVNKFQGFASQHPVRPSQLQLVPLNLLENASLIPRDPMDEQLLQKFKSLAPLRPSPTEFRQLSSSSFTLSAR